MHKLADLMRPQYLRVSRYPRGPLSMTSYCIRGIMADGSYTRPRSAAANHLRLGTKVRIAMAGPHGWRRYVIRDRIGWGSELDLWAMNCSTALRWGRHRVHYRLGW